MSAIFDNYQGTVTPYLALMIDNTNDWAGQSFTPILSHSLEQVEFHLSKGPGDDVGLITISLHEVDGSNHPTGAALATGTITSASVPETGSSDWVLCTFGTPFTIVPLTKYCYIVHATGVDASNRLYLTYDDLFGASAFYGGDLEWSTNGGSSWTTTTTSDILFRNTGTGNLYTAGLYAIGQNGFLLKWNDIDSWLIVAPQLAGKAHPQNTKVSGTYPLVAYNGKMYSVVSTYGLLLEWNGAGTWIPKADNYPDANTAINDLLVYHGKLYGGGSYLYEWNDVDAWVEKANCVLPVGSIVIYNDKIYGGVCATSGGQLLEYNGTDAWIQVAPYLTTPGGADAVICLKVYNGKLYAGMGGEIGQAKLYQWNDTDAWIQVAPRLTGNSIPSLEIFNGSLFGGVDSGYAELQVWNGSAWINQAGGPGQNPTGAWAINSLEVYFDLLYGGTGTFGGDLWVWDGVGTWLERAPALPSTTSINALLWYTIAPTITNESTDQSILLGQLLTLFVAASGDPTPTYQWYHDGILINGATSSTYLIYVSLIDSGNYYCIVTNVAGNDTSSQIPVEVVSNPYRYYNPYNVPLDSERI